MGRASTLASASNMVANPYGRPKEIQSLTTHCLTCDRTIKTKDWRGHENSKGHRKLKDGETLKENIGAMTSDTGATKSAFSEVTGEKNAGWSADPSWGGGSGDFGTTTGNFDNPGAAGTGNPRGGSGGPCYGCGETGHMKRDCPQASSGRACFNCGETGHNKVDCPQPLKPRGGDRACFNCGQTGHSKADCTEPLKPREGGGGQCFNCYEFGHRKSECPNERVMKCKNCDEIGHMARECPKPKDWSRVQCNNCKEFGHTIKRCTAAPAEDTGGSGGWDTQGDVGAASGGWENNITTDQTNATGAWADSADSTTDASWMDANTSSG